MLNRKKHGFTVVELVIVIAVIAILAAVLIPTFIGIVNSAKKSADTTLIRNLNTALKADKPDGEPHATMTDALAAVEKSGYDVAKINKTMLEGHQIVWDSERGVFAYMDTTGSKPTFEYVPDSDNYTALGEDEFYKYWVIASEPSDKFSTYLYNYKGGSTVTVSTGLDVGTFTGIDVTYENKSGKEQDVILRTNGGKLTVKDTTNSKQIFYGYAKRATINTGNDCFYAYGKIESLTLNAGKVVAEKNSMVVVYKTAQNTTVTYQNGGVVLVDKDGKIANNTVAESSTAEVGASLFAGGDGTEANPYLIATCEQALNMEYANGCFKMTADVTVTDEIYLSGKPYTIDLNGHTLKLEYADGVKPNNGSVLYIGGKKGNLTINDSSEAGTGAVIGSDKTYTNKVTSAVRAGNYGTLTINGGHFYGMSEGTSCIFVYTGRSSGSKATVVINGGTFETASPSNGKYYVLNHQDSATAGCTITVNGGRFKNYNPGVTVVDPVNAYTGTISLGAGCTTTSETDGSDTWYVVSK